ncbi:hypothetical protein CcI156_01590 [Frankia sp. CcI156]|jgi:uncharacterized repeat protein (TIGR03917 family)|nr:MULTISPECIES: hypothetical protein [Frankia]ETA02571.1 hypothetical protein CcI6DRAFT_01958 [Frankia sp. CcI6]EYT92755.1 hypothetical protein ThrDRAFT_01530 [Frankia casuarinae]KDA42062.1 hypothetical protein BMG523Draft_03073 [Frankia sp. BMG5.23]KEZ35456.1 Frankia-40 domain [Frankia sp. CeD]KFB07140.1 Frankia-40 domain [Frankia sp. Allo2]
MNTVDNDDLLPEPRPVIGGRPRSLAEVVTVNDGLLVQHELLLAPGATAADLTTAMILVPPTAALVSHHGDVDVSLVFQEVSRDARRGVDGQPVGRGGDPGRT